MAKLANQDELQQIISNSIRDSLGYDGDQLKYEYAG